MQPGKIDPCDMKVYMDMKVYIREVRGPDPRPDPRKKSDPRTLFSSKLIYSGDFSGIGDSNTPIFLFYYFELF